MGISGSASKLNAVDKGNNKREESAGRARRRANRSGKGSIDN